VPGLIDSRWKAGNYVWPAAHSLIFLLLAGILGGKNVMTP
jgi:hypothetical protein